MQRYLLAALAFAVWVAPMVTIVPSSAAAEPSKEVSAEDVRAAIEFGKTFLLDRQLDSGGWSDYGEIVGRGIVFPGGTTSLATLALLTAGMPADDPRMQAALKRLERYRPDTTYVVALQTLAFCQANPRQYLNRIQQNADWLMGAEIMAGPGRGAWSYKSPGGTDGDNSNSQFALLALHEAARAGATVKPEAWNAAREYWEDAQNIDGSWGYYKKSLGTGSMTCAGISSLIITSDKFRRPNADVRGNRIVCCQQASDDDNNRVERGLAWMGRNFRVKKNPGNIGEMWALYYLYGVERVGRMTNHRYFYQADGTARDWYREGAAHLVNMRDTLGDGWSEAGGGGERDPIVNTSFVLLFLSKGRRPVLMAKLKHSLEEDWNQHRSDVDNLTHYVETRWRRDLTWQITDMRKATVEDLLQSPVLYFGGSLDPLPAPGVAREQLAQKLRDYLDRGGFLFAEGYCGGRSFDRGFRELMALVFPEPEYRMQLLSPDHPVWRAEEVVPAEFMRPLMGIDYGCRTSVIYAPPDPPAAPRPSLSCLWELSRPGRDVTYERPVRDQIDAGLSIGINVLAYATNRELKGKEDLFHIAPIKAQPPEGQRGTIYVAKLRHPGGCNAAPRALANLLEAGQGELKLRTSAEAKLIDLADESLFDYHLVFMHGRTAFRLTDAERLQLKTYLERGGMLFADAICTSQPFIDSFTRELSAIFPDQKLEPIAATDPILTGKYGGYDLETVRRRDPQRGAGPLESSVHSVAPELEGLKLGDRWAVVFSPYDVSCALEKRQTMECRGYVPDDAARIGLNVLLYSLQQ